VNITVFGATGAIGSLVVEQALADGHQVTAFTRDTSRVTARHDRLEIVAGDVTDPGACLPTARGADAVVVALRAAYADHGRQEHVVEESDLDWTIVRPSAFTDRSPGPFRHGFDGSAQGMLLKIGRSDVAAFLLAQVQDGTYLGRTVSVSA
jgi:uncharacterized protein YbjT (DUF2867 family)